MKIGITCPASLPAIPFGGILMISVNFAKRFSELKHDVTIYTSDMNFSGKKIIFDKTLPELENINSFKIKRSHVLFKSYMFL